MSLFFTQSNPPRRVHAFVMSVVGGSMLGLAAGVHGEELSTPPAGPAPSVDAVEELPLVQPSYAPATEEAPAPAAAQPPLDDIPPMPMPQPKDPNAVSPANQDPGAPVFHDLQSQQTITGAVADTVLSDAFSQGGYYAGADGGPGEGETAPASFGTKLLLGNVNVSPWRMNVKLAMRFGNSWFVCSGAMRDVRTVQTAGHCIHQGNGGSFADEVLVYPGWDGDGTIIPFDPDLDNYGAARGVSLGSWTGWTVNGNTDFDWGVIALDRAVGSLTGWYGWQTGNTCPTATYNVGSYPAEGCGQPGLHNGRDQYYWWGTIDSCPGNQLQINTTAGCLTALWGGESGSNLYELANGNRYTRGIASTSNRTTIGNYVETKSAWVNWLNSTFIPNNARGNTFDLQALDVNVSPTTIRAGTSTSSINHLGANGTDGSKNANFSFDIRLSSNDQITTFDTLLSNQVYSFNYGPASSARVNSSNVTIPENTPPGTYWLGMRYSNGTDGNSGNNDSSDWDAQRIVVLQETTPPSPNPMFFSANPSAIDPDQIGMTATTASDPSGGVSYYFDFVSSPTGGSGGSDSGWQASRSYTDSGLQDLHEYCYRVRARDTYSNATSYSAVRCATTPTLKKCNGQTVTILGTAGNDVISGTAGPDVINGLAGDDYIDGLGGNDIICGGKGNDDLRGGNGADQIYGQAGSDQLRGNNGWDSLYGGSGPDFLYGNKGNDNLFGQGGADTMAGGTGVDVCNGGSGGSDTAAGNCETVVNVP